MVSIHVELKGEREGSYMYWANNTQEAEACLRERGLSPNTYDAGILWEKSEWQGGYAFISRTPPSSSPPHISTLDLQLS